MEQQLGDHVQSEQKEQTNPSPGQSCEPKTTDVVDCDSPEKHKGPEQERDLRVEIAVEEVAQRNGNEDGTVDMNTPICSIREETNQTNAGEIIAGQSPGSPLSHQISFRYSMSAMQELEATMYGMVNSMKQSNKAVD